MTKFDWKLQLVSPSGDIFDVGTMGYASSTLEHSYIFPQIKEFLEGSTLTQREFVLEDLTQMLLNPGFHRFHGYRVAWGSHSPEERYSAYPNGQDLDWTLYRLINGQTRTLVQGKLPENWWDLDEDERYQIVEAL